MCTGLCNLSILQYIDLVRIRHRRQTMCDHDHRLILGQVLKSALYLSLIVRIGKCGRLV